MDINELLRDRRRQRGVGPAPESRQLPDDARQRHAASSPPKKSGSTRPTPRRWRTRSSARISARSSAARRKWTSPTALPGLGRFRCNVFQQRGTVGLVLRVIPTRIKTIDELGLPPVLRRSPQEERGLVLVTGTTGSGKSTTLAAMIDYINSTPRGAHHDGRGPDRVPAPGPPLDRQPARSQRRHAVVLACAAQRPAAGPRRHPGRRDARLTRRSRRRSSPPKPATSSSRRCTRSTPPRPSTASSPSSRRTSSARSASSSPACSRRRRAAPAAARRRRWAASRRSKS